jgi:hypothetical protein
MPDSRRTGISAMVLLLLLATTSRGRAFELGGPGRQAPTNATRCSPVTAESFTDLSDVYGGGFIVDGDQIIGKFARCKIKARKDGRQTVNLIAACATDIMLSSVQLSAKALDADTIIRLFPGMDDIEIRYSRCPSP